MDFTLIVVRRFLDYRPGDVIEDAARAAAILKSENVRNVVRVLPRERATATFGEK